MLDELPAGRQRVDTFVVDESYRPRLNAFIEKQVNEGGQVYIVCPTVEGKEDGEGGDLISFGPDGSAEFALDKPPLKNATDHAEYLSGALNNCRVGLIHGRMKGKEKDEVMSAFSRGETDVLVSTTVIEVGINVPNATLMVVENAERFGLSQLHQLRGRVGRGDKKSYCVLVSDQKTEKAMARLEIMRSTYDGYEIADKDLALRGPGDFFSQNSSDTLRQSDGFDFKFAKLCDDVKLFDAAFSVAKGIIAADPDLSKPEHALLKKNFESLLEQNASGIS
jgi:ATP-dependent DNA helicase RecG